MKHNIFLEGLIPFKKFTDKKTICQKCAYFNCSYVPSYFGVDNIVIIGEAPGQTEIKLKTPFVGQSGILLRTILQEIGFDDTKISFLNAVYCWPKNNGAPDKKVIKLCTKYFLLPELQQLNPKLIILAGATALNVFFPHYKIMDKRGKLLMNNDKTYLPILHPSYCLRNINATDYLRKDLKKAALFLTDKNEKKETYVLIETIDELEKYKNILIQSDIIAIDIETNNKLNPFDKDIELWTIGFGIKNCNICVPIDHPDIENIAFRSKVPSFIRDILETDIPKICHNCSFELKMLKHFGYKINGIIHDTMVLAYLLDENKSSYSLKELSAEYLDGYIYKFSTNLRELYKYNCADVENTYKLYTLFIADIKQFPLLYDVYKKIVLPMCYVIADMEYNGIKINLDYCVSLKNLLVNNIYNITQNIHLLCPESQNINLKSSKQLSYLLYDVLKLFVYKQTTKGHRSVDMEVLEKLAKKHNLAKHLLQLRNNEKLLSTYVEGIPKKIDYDSRIRSNFYICGTRTARLASFSPNLQNIPRNKDIKKMFIAEKNNVLINIDAQQAELKVACSIANERNMINAYNQGIDIHKLTASKICDKHINQVTEEERQKAKGVNFGFLYGASAEGFKEYAEKMFNLEIPLKECELFRRKYFDLYPNFLNWHNKIERTLRNKGYIEYPTGRRARFLQVKGLKEIPREILRRGINYPVQGSSADLIFYTMIELRKFITISKAPVKIVCTVHDSIVLECLRDYATSIVAEIKDIASLDIPKEFIWLRVNWVYDFMIGDNWGEMEKI